MAKIEIENMNLFYGDFQALKDINLKIDANEITAFIGPSGCGKSTLLRSINRMNDMVEECHITGKIQIDGKDILEKKIDVNELRKKVGMVFQKPNPFPMSIYDNIAFGPRTHGKIKKADLDEIVETSLRNAAIWDELKDNLKKFATIFIFPLFHKKRKYIIQRLKYLFSGHKKNPASRRVLKSKFFKISILRFHLLFQNNYIILRLVQQLRPPWRARRCCWPRFVCFGHSARLNSTILILPYLEFL